MTDYTNKELEYLQDQDFLITKNTITDKTFELLSAVQNQLQQKVPSSLGKKSPKISKGEQYLGLPYMVLDYPRIFEHQDVFAFRTMFWWGNFFSSTLHLGGRYLDIHRQRIIANQQLIKQADYYFCLADDPWHYHFQAENYQLSTDLSDEDLHQALKERSFIKFSKKWPLSEYSNLVTLVSDSWENLQSILGVNK